LRVLPVEAVYEEVLVPTLIRTKRDRNRGELDTEDERFILERHGRVVIGSACSGHGFKFAPAIGRRLADLAAGQRRRP